MIEFDIFVTETHYEKLCSWWAAQKWPSVAKNHLPPRGCGVFRDGELAAAGFLYINGSALGNFEWIVADPKVRRDERTEVLSALFAGVKQFAKCVGIESIFMSTRHESLIARLEKAGFQKTDLNMTNLVGRV